jgi:hypothetical protein
MSQKNNFSNWKSTDPSTKQWGRQITPTIFEFKEGETTFPTLVDLGQYPDKEQEHIINAYGYTLLSGENQNKRLKNIYELYGKEANWIIAECIFESEQY